ncbi:hypothetical protein N656DRAFT_362006 [Canariomyces notabilis]|uniref:DUF676 domain-containing protein n=1 Tax=Canariomyces notabilis TaxID=2074819 RepID=A0AAN6QES2_9PEZI|nr:hypothetical protein N656DRAFT_362006 [Canariomyces arenarius]
MHDIGVERAMHMLPLKCRGFPCRIIAIHGLGGDKFGSWTSPSGNGALWIRDFLKDSFPRARIFTYGYDAGKAWLSNSVATIEDAAKDLLARLQIERDGLPLNRPIVFICHSLGGIVLKTALLEASDRRRHFEFLLDAPKGVVFMGTPHLGSPVATALNLLVRVPGIARNLRLNVALLADHSLELDRLCERFVEQAADLKFILSFYETQHHPILRQLIVNKRSATMRLSHEDRIPLAADHHLLCKFELSTDPRFTLVLGQLKMKINRMLLAAGSARPSMESDVPMASPSRYDGSRPTPSDRPSPALGSGPSPTPSASSMSRPPVSPNPSLALQYPVTPPASNTLPPPQPRNFTFLAAQPQTEAPTLYQNPQLSRSSSSFGSYLASPSANNAARSWDGQVQSTSQPAQSPGPGQGLSHQMERADKHFRDGNFREAIDYYRCARTLLEQPGVASCHPGQLFVVYDQLARCCLNLCNMSAACSSWEKARTYLTIARDYAGQSLDHVGNQRVDFKFCRARMTYIALDIMETEMKSPNFRLSNESVARFANEMSLLEEELASLRAQGYDVEDLLAGLRDLKRAKLSSS